MTRSSKNGFDRALLPEIITSVPGPRSQALARRLSQVESRNVTYLGPPGPIFWQRASGANVWDVDGNRYLDLGAAFGVANVGHAHPRVVDAVAAQTAELMHGMGDVHPTDVKVELLETLAARFPGPGPARAVLGSSGSDAVESALKTATLATGRAGVLAFAGGYHGLAFGALDATHRDDFRAPFAARLPAATHFAEFGVIEDVVRVLDSHEAASSAEGIGAILVEPIQGRGGERIPPDGFLGELRTLCDERGLLLIADEIYTGFGRTGSWFACEHERVTPDLICVGKGLASGMPISACIGRAEVMDAWPASPGEALHTQTFLGHPPSCAAALASIRALEEEDLVTRARKVGDVALQQLRERVAPIDGVRETRGRGLMLGIECARSADALRVCSDALEIGLILLPSGEGGRVLSLTPPLCIDAEALTFAIEALAKKLDAVANENAVSN